MQPKQTTSQVTGLKTRPAWVVVSGFVIAGAFVSGAILLFNILGMQHESIAADPSRYPFDVTANTLQKVNFTVLDAKINTIFAEVRPFISTDGRELFFCRRNHVGNIGREKDRQDIWITDLQPDGQWSTPRNAGTMINSKSADAICSVSPDGSEIIFFHEEIAPDKVLMRSTRLEDGWSAPEFITVENYYNNDPYVDFFYSYESNVLLMAVTRNDTKGDQDLYISFPRADKNKWSEPVSLGPIVNSNRSDFAPFLAADGRTLFFSSYGHAGLGGCDIYQTTRLDDSWKNWSEPKNLGEGINSAREESYFSISGDYRYIYFESYDLEKEVRDIFRADLPEIFKPASLYMHNDESASARRVQN